MISCLSKILTNTRKKSSKIKTHQEDIGSSIKILGNFLQNLMLNDFYNLETNFYFKILEGYDTMVGNEKRISQETMFFSLHEPVRRPPWRATMGIKRNNV